MKKFLKVFLFMVAFQMEIRVKASDSAMIEQPSGCIKKASDCVVKALADKANVALGAGQIYMQAGSILKKESASDWTFVQGQVWFHQTSGSVQSLYSSFYFSSGDFWLESQEGQVLVRNVSADLKVVMRDGKTLQVPAGFQFWVAGLNTKGKSDFGMIEPINGSEHIRNWGALYPGTKDEFKKELSALKESWKSLTEASADIYQGAADRQVASVKAAERAEKRRQEQIRLERQKLKDLFFERTFNR